MASTSLRAVPPACLVGPEMESSSISVAVQYSVRVQLIIGMACSSASLGLGDLGDLPRENGLFLLYLGLNTIAGRLVCPEEQ
jgi:hypothetical protein